MVGTGALSRYLVEGHLAVRRYASVLVWGRNSQKAAEVVRDLAAQGWNAHVAPELESAARSADVISCATLAEESLIKGAWLKTKCHLDLVGSYKPTMREADDACVRGAFIVVDTLAALQGSGDLAEPLVRGVIAADSVCLLKDLATPPLSRPRATRTVFKSVGVAHADLATAEYVYGRHQA
jgi:ornithine cyclodeaminase/alanine dehydrogenase-like protein (mu-crystallin family)